MDKTTWREQRVTIEPHTAETIYFRDTYPNHILLNNSSPSPVFFGASIIPNPSNYDMVIPGYGTRLFPRMTGTDRIYLYTDGKDGATIQISSWEGEFNPASIPQSQEMVGAGADGLMGIVDVNGFMSPLPAGGNYLGQVGIDSFNNPLPQGDNVIGHVLVDNFDVLKDYSSQLESIIGKLNNIKDYSLKFDAVSEKLTTIITSLENIAQLLENSLVIEE
jgi:hypothetical protein